MLTDLRDKAPSPPYDLGLFRHPDRARRDLECLESRIPSELVHVALGLLAETPDPDQSLNLFERLTTGANAELLSLLDKNRVLLHYTLAIFGHSYWLGESAIQHPDTLYSLQREKNLERSLAREDFRENFARFRSRLLETDTSVLLARFKKRECVRIMLRDVLGIATLAETTAELSALADMILEEALREAEQQMQRRYGPPQYTDAAGRTAQARFTVLSLGKLGGNELNYSSDVDLLYLFGGDEPEPQPDGRLRAYFIRQAQLMTEILSRATPEGAVFRMDLRLRPQGAEGEPASGLQQALHYYAHTAHDWELQALIKARHSAGDLALARAFIQGVQRHVYKANVNFRAIETAMHSREKIGAARRRHIAGKRLPATLDVKLDRGGIRDIEFLVQCLQRVYGGEEKWLRSGGTLFSLQKLHDKGHISGKDFHELTLAYEFLRRLEHRLQLQRGQQVHRLPEGKDELRVLKRTMQPEAEGPSGKLVPDLCAHMARVAEIYQRIIHHHRKKEKEGSAPGPLAPLPSTAREMSFSQVLERIAQDSPQLHSVVAREDLDLHTRRNLHRFLSSAMTSPERYAALLEGPANVERAIALFAASDYLTEILVRHPDAIRALGELSGSPAEVRQEIPAGETPSLEQAPLDPGEALASLRRGFRKHVFLIGAQDVLSPRPAFQSMHESSRVADLAIRLALRIIGAEEKLAVFALGRLGTNEFDIASDGDLLFVRAVDSGAEAARAAAEDLVHALAAYTREGSIFAVDTRLRPHGGEGELVVTARQLERYLAEEAQPWEALTYTKLRFVAGREDLKPVTLAPVWHRIVEMAARPGFAQAVAEMRARLEKSNRYPHSFKLARGGFYDIDFIASFLMLREASLAQGNTLDRLQHLREQELLSQMDFATLRDAALLYRTTDRVIRLVTGRARPELPEAEHARKAVEKLVDAVLGQPKDKDLQRALQETAEAVRRIFERIVSG